MNADEIIRFFDMRPLPGEGGFYVETYRAAEKIAQSGLPERYTGPRDFSTAILYLVTPKSFSKLHRVKSDEIFHFYLGDAVDMLQLAPEGGATLITLGQNIFASQQLQAAVGAGTWQGCRLSDSGKFALLGCTVAPGFEFKDYETADKEKLIQKFPAQKDWIEKLTYSNGPFESR
jgi:hypothetical protein